MKFAEVICLQETWIEPHFSSTNVLEEDGWMQHNICLGRGRGVSTLFKGNFDYIAQVKNERFQMLKVASKELDIINVYRSNNANTSQFLNELLQLINLSNRTTIVGDFNLCFDSERSHPVFRFLENSKFKQLVQNATHIKGRLIDLVFTNSPEEVIRVSQNGQYFSDHDLITIY